MRDPKTGLYHAKRMAGVFGVRPSQLARPLGVNKSTVIRHPTAPKLQGPAARLEQLFYDLERMLGSPERARAWLKTPSEIWGGKTAWDLIEDGDLDIVLAVVRSLKEGAPL